MNRSQHWAAVLAHKLDWPAKFSGSLVGWMIIPMILSLTYEVVARYAFESPTMWAYDMTFMLYGAFFMLGSAYTLQKKGHIRTDMYYGNWSPKKQAVVDIICYLIFFYPLVFIFVVTGWEYFWQAFTTNEKFVSSPWMPITWPFKLVIPVTGLLLAIQGFAELLKCISAIAENAWPDQEQPHEQ